MQKFVAVLSVMGVLFLTAVTVVPLGSTSTQVAAAENEKEKPSGLVPVEEDMHEFMEYVFQPTYRRLKQQMAQKNKNRPVWKQIKSDALILAEASNLTMIRGSKNSPDWNRYSVKVRDLGGQLYRAAKKGDDAAAQQHYRAMLTKCNACHKKFAGGKHQLKP